MIPFITGILGAGILETPAWPAVTVGLTAAMIWIGTGMLPPWQAWRWEPVRGVAVICCIGSAGWLTLHGKQASMSRSEGVAEADDPISGWICTLEETPVRKKKSLRATATLQAVTKSRQLIPAGKTLIYFPADMPEKTPVLGQRLLTCEPPQALRGPEFPGGFDAAGYYGRQGISQRVYLPQGAWHILPGAEAPWHIKLTERARHSILERLQRHIAAPVALGMAEALLIGYRNDLDEKLSDAYADTGVIHVIAISGLHIGIIYSLLAGLFRQILRSPQLAWIGTVSALAGIWGFGLLAGGGPSVMRSVCMFSIIGLGKQLTGREGQGINTLAATACLMLSIQPWWLWDLGFQLSFAAVASLMLFSSSVQGWLSLKNTLAVKCWEMISVTLAAQVLTTPILLLVFGRFPVFFLITNLVAIPLSTLILLTEIALCLLAPLHAATGDALGLVTETLIQAMNGYILQMNGIPFGIIEDIQLSIPQVLVLYACIACLATWTRRWQPAWLLSGLCCLTIFGGLRALELSHRSKQQICMIMPLTQTRLLMLADGRSCRWLWSSYGSADSRHLRMAMRNAAHHFGIMEERIDTLPTHGHVVITWGGLNIHLLGPAAPRKPSTPMDSADIILLSGNCRIDLEAWRKSATRATWIADATNKLWKIQEWETPGEGLPLRLFYTRRSGAFIRQIQ